MLISYSLTPEFLRSAWDWIGLYKVMWPVRQGVHQPYIPLWFIHPEGSRELGTETEELTLVHPRGPCPPGSWQSRGGGIQYDGQP